MQLAKISLIFPLLFSFVLLIIGSIYTVQTRKKIWLILSLLASIGMTGGVFYFLIENVGKAIALHNYDYFGLWTSMGTGGLVGIAGLVIWRMQKKWYPGAFITFLSIVHVSLLFFAKLYFAR